MPQKSSTACRGSHKSLLLHCCTWKDPAYLEARWRLSIGIPMLNLIPAKVVRDQIQDVSQDVQLVPELVEERGCLHDSGRARSCSALASSVGLQCICISSTTVRITKRLLLTSCQLPVPFTCAVSFHGLNDSDTGHHYDLLSRVQSLTLSSSGTSWWFPSSTLQAGQSWCRCRGMRLLAVRPVPRFDRLIDLCDRSLYMTCGYKKRLTMPWVVS
jgi:hypothetical protein